MQRSTGKDARRAETANQRWQLAAALVVAASVAPVTAHARPAAMAPNVDASDDSEALPYLQCVPFAREASGIQLYGDALTWWDQAAGRYARGHEPRPGAVMSFRPYGPMTLGHVAMVSKVIDERTVLLRHANWSPIDGRRGHVELDVRAVDVSPDNDWSEVRVWYAPIGDLGTTHWPVNGFIYKQKPRHEAGPRDTTLAWVDRDGASLPAPHRAAKVSRIDASFLDGIKPEIGHAPVRTPLVAHPPAHAPAVSSLRDDPIGRIIAARMVRSTG